MDSRQLSLPAGTTSSDPPRPCARIDTASWTSTFVEPIHEPGASNPRREVSSAGQSGSNDGTNQTARFNVPTGIAVDATGNLYVADIGSSTIRKITAAGVVTTLAGSPGLPGSLDGTGSAARFLSPGGSSRR